MTADRAAVVEAMARAIEWPDEYACACEGMDCADPQAHREQWRTEQSAAALDAALPLIVGPLREGGLSLTRGSSVFMDGTGDYHLRRTGKPGVVATLVLSFDVAEELTAALDALPGGQA